MFNLILGGFIMKETIKNIGKFNNWKGCMGLYFTKKELRAMKEYGITDSTPIREAYDIIANH